MKKNRRDFVLLIIFLIAFALVQILFSTSDGLENTPFTVFSAKKEGVSLFYETIKELGLPVGISNEPIHKSDTSSLQIIIEPDLSLLDIESALEWVDDGGSVVLLIENAWLAKSLFPQDISEALSSEGISAFYEPSKYGEGSISFLEATGITNQGIYNDSTNSYVIAKILENIPHEQILFNEYYHGYGVKNTLWTDSPLWVKFFLTQMVLIVVFILIYFGRRFGKPVPYFEEIEREENEYVDTVGTLYKKSKSPIHEIYYDEFIEKASAYLKTDANIEAIEKEWRAKNLKHLDYFKFLQKEIKDTNGLKKFVSRISELNKTLERSDD